MRVVIESAYVAVMKYNLRVAPHCPLPPIIPKQNVILPRYQRLQPASGELLSFKRRLDYGQASQKPWVRLTCRTPSVRVRPLPELASVRHQHDRVERTCAAGEQAVALHAAEAPAAFQRP